jgi:hypothetical protein
MVEKVKAIFKEFKSEPEEIGDDILIFKCVLPKKGNCESTIRERLGQWGPPGCYVAHDNDMLVGRNKLRPDVAFWMVAPTGEQLESPQDPSNPMPLPDVWVEGAYEGADQRAAQTILENIVDAKIYRRVQKPVACLLIVLPHLRDYDSIEMAAYAQRTNLTHPLVNNDIQAPNQAQIAALMATLGPLANHANGVDLAHTFSAQITQFSYQVNLAVNSTPAEPLPQEPEEAPKIAYWQPGATEALWFQVKRGHRIEIQVPGASSNNPFQFYMDWIMGALAHPLPVQVQEAAPPAATPPPQEDASGPTKRAKRGI